MRYLRIIRSLCLMMLGITIYSILLCIVGWRIPGRLRRHHKGTENKHYRRKALIVLGYYTLLAFLIILGYVLIKYVIWGEI